MEDDDSDDDFGDDLGGSINARGLSCHCLVESVTRLAAGCLSLFLSGRGGPEDPGDDMSEDDGLSEEGGLGGATASVGSGEIMLRSSCDVWLLRSCICDLDILEQRSICWS